MYIERALYVHSHNLPITFNSTFNSDTPILFIALQIYNPSSEAFTSSNTIPLVFVGLYIETNIEKKKEYEIKIHKL